MHGYDISFAMNHTVFIPYKISAKPYFKEFFYFCVTRLDIKRLMDILIALPLILICMCLLPLAAFFVTYQSKGSIFYSQYRYGKNKKPFRIFKLRTLHSHLCDDGQQQVVHKDPRVTRHGEWLRRYSLDELPQLLNVLMGDMSLVGPRPHSIAMDDYYREFIIGYDNRYLAKPGLTGLAQIHGSRGETRLIQDMEKRIDYDTEYVINRSLKMDVLILLRTLSIVARPA